MLQMKKKLGISSFQLKILGFCLSISAFFLGYLVGIFSHSMTANDAQLINTKPVLKVSCVQNNGTPKTLSAFISVGIMTSPSNTLRRRVIRETWLSSWNNEIHHRFIIGTAKISYADQMALVDEHHEHKDLLLLPDVMDSYNNLTLKLLSYIKWLDAKVNFTYFLKTDDDTFAQLDQIFFKLKSKEVHTKFYWGFFDGRARVKHYGPWAEKNWILCDHYLPYAKGGAYVLSSDLVHFISRNVEFLQVFNSEDVSIGAWLGSLKINRIHDSNFDTEYESRGCFNSYLATHKQSPQKMIEKHNNIKRTGQMCIPEVRYKNSYIYNWKVPPSLCCVRNSSKYIV